MVGFKAWHQELLGVIRGMLDPVRYVVYLARGGWLGAARAAMEELEAPGDVFDTVLADAREEGHQDWHHEVLQALTGVYSN